MQLHEALKQSKSGAAQAKKDDKTLICRSNVVKDFRAIYAYRAGRTIQSDDLGYSISIQEGDAPPSHHERVEELWEVEESVRINFGITGLD